MKGKMLCIMLLSILIIFSMAACGTEGGKKPTDTSPTVKIEEITFKAFSGDYIFSSGAGGWFTNVTINGDGTFSGVFYDMDMGVMGEGYPNGTVRLCEFNGKFSELQKKDDFTYTCSLEEITQKEETGKETINQEEGVKYIYSDPCGFDDAKDFEFYLPGKSTADCNSKFLSWTSIRYSEPYPDTLFGRAFNNLSNMYGFEEVVEYSQSAEVSYPESLPLESGDLTGLYNNKKLGIDMGIAYMGSEDGNGEVLWYIPEDVKVWNENGIFLPAENGFDVKIPTLNDEYMTSYKIIVTDNTAEKVVIHLYDKSGRDCGEYVMTEHWTAYKTLQQGTDLLSVLFNSSSAMTVRYGSYPWRVIGYDGYGVASESSTLTLISAGNLGQSAFDSNGVTDIYANSTLQKNIDAIANRFSDEEKNAVARRTLSSGAYNVDNPNETDGVAGSAVADALLWPLSTKEANAMDEKLRQTDPENGSLDSSIWWLRSPSFHDDIAAVVYGGGDVMPDGHLVHNEFGMRPAFRLNLSSVFMISLVEGGKPSAFEEVRGTWRKDWKLTLSDNTTGFRAGLPSEGTAGERVKVNVTTMPEGGTVHNQISAMLADGNNVPVAYGKIGAAKTGEITFTIPKTVPEGTYTLRVFPEQTNGDNETDYAGNVVENANFQVRGASD